MLGVWAKRLVSLVALTASAAGAVATEGGLRQSREAAQERLTPPAPILRHFTFGHRRGVSALLWVQTLAWYGGEAIKLQGKQFADPDKLRHTKRQIDLIIELDPQFSDPYLFAGMLFAYDGKAPLLGISYLEKGVEQFPDNYRFAFYAGALYMHLLRDDAKASDLFLKASRLPEAPVYLAGLASDLKRRESGTETALQTLQALLRENLPEETAVLIRAEVTTLRAVYETEKALDAYKRRFGPPASLEDLVKTGYLNQLPVDAAGDPLQLTAEGKIRARGQARDY